MTHRTTMLALLTLLAAAAAQMPEETLGLSGLLEDGMGAAATGPVSIVFTIHDDATAGSVLWSETHPVVALDSAGRYQVTLGMITPLLPAIFADPNTWLTLDVNGDGEMTPRLALGRVPSAHNAALLDGSPPSVFAPKAELDDMSPATSPVGWGDLSSVPGGFADGIDDVDDADNDPMNEIETWMTLAGIPAGFFDGVDDVDDADNDPMNEIETWMTLAGIPAGFADDVDDVDDADNDPMNEIETWLTLGGIPAGFADGTDDVDDADSSPTNEIQSLTLMSTMLGITGGGAGVDLAALPPATVIEDADDDTRVRVEESPDEDTIRFYLAGIQRWNMQPYGGLWPGSTGGSIFIGFGAGQNDDQAARHNTYLGQDAGSMNVMGADNVAIGWRALLRNLATGNTAVGVQALGSNVTGVSNVAVGRDALALSTSNNNTAVGDRALSAQTTAQFNTAVGANALLSTTGGSSNVALGESALRANTNGGFNTAVGESALRSNAGGSGNVAVGGRSLRLNTSSSNTAVGGASLEFNTTGARNVAIGEAALRQNTIGLENTAIGRNALDLNTSARDLVAVGYRAMRNNDADSNTAVGHSAMELTTTGGDNVAVGRSALAGNTIGAGNTAVGHLALDENLDGSQNTAVGAASGGNLSMTSYSNSTAIGNAANYTASNMVRLGDASVTTIEGQVMFTSTSDARFKRNVAEDVPGLELIRRLRPVTYNMDTLAFDAFIGEDRDLTSGELAAHQKRAELRETGFIAQEVEEAAHSIGYDFNGVDAPQDEQDPYGLRYAAFVVPLVKAVQELDRRGGRAAAPPARIEELERTVAAQAEQIARLEELILKSLATREPPAADKPGGRDVLPR